jgi:hypothetical protein
VCTNRQARTVGEEEKKEEEGQQQHSLYTNGKKTASATTRCALLLVISFRIRSFDRAKPFEIDHHRVEWMVDEQFVVGRE